MKCTSHGMDHRHKAKEYGEEKNQTKKKVTGVMCIMHFWRVTRGDMSMLLDDCTSQKLAGPRYFPVFTFTTS